MSQAVEGMTTDHLHDDHEQYDYDCSVCREDFDEAYAEHAWMGRVSPNWTGGNPYVRDPQAPRRDWYIDGEGWVKVDA